MPKSLVLGNGSTLIGLDNYGRLRDFYFPHVGLESHMDRFCVHRIGAWVEGKISWIDDKDWKISVNYKKETLASEIEAINENIGIRLYFNDVVYNEKNIFLRKVRVANLANAKREIKLFFGQQFQIYETNRGNTAYFDPKTDTIIHYKGRRILLISGLLNNKGFSDYSIGLFNTEGREGSWKDAEDGILEKNPIEHGSVDSVVGFYETVDAKGVFEVYYWIITTKEMKELKELNEYVLRKSPAHLLESTQDYWYAWVNKNKISLSGLDEGVIDFFKKSLLIIRTHIDNNGAVIASGDSDLLQYGRDWYSYIWPRDAALIITAMNKAGYYDIARRFFEFAKDLLSSEGYFYHKYLTDKALGSSWHPWIDKNGEQQLPIQEDETALVLFSFWKYYKSSRNLELVEEVYNSLIKKTADFMLSYRDKKTGLPKASYDLWEEKMGISTYTACAVAGALKAASNFARLLGKEYDEKIYLSASADIKEAILKFLYCEEGGYFYKLIEVNKNKIFHDHTIDMSTFYGLFYFDILDCRDKRMLKFLKIIDQRILCQTEVGGYARYENDAYHQISKSTPGNPWIITTLWMVQYYIKKARSEKELLALKKWFNWVLKYAHPSGVLSEQLNPFSGEQISATPLAWSQAEFVVTVIRYLDKIEKIKKGLGAECILKKNWN